MHSEAPGGSLRGTFTKSAIFGQFYGKKTDFLRLFPCLIHHLLFFMQFSDIIGNAEPAQIQVVLF